MFMRENKDLEVVRNERQGRARGDDPVGTDGVG